MFIMMSLLMSMDVSRVSVRFLDCPLYIEARLFGVAALTMTTLH